MGIVTARQIWPGVRFQPHAEALRPLLILHNFRLIGLAVLVPGVTSSDLPLAFAHSEAYGDIIAVALALFFATVAQWAGAAVAWIFGV